MPLDRAWQQGGFLGEFLGVVFAKVRVGQGRLVEGEDVIGRFEFGDCDKTNLNRGEGGRVNLDERECVCEVCVEMRWKF